ncbi:uncharacterized protein IL334_002110 [Kwoniella shivajii]|uniref:DNA-directed RNA polymerase I, II, and III subunit RPABC4 n=1 Tax=Kwoniella shivajii TaxID=564305 RepID=A0ABZ1CTR9_9TREE|nr:hypothetical protein IL334_002110 [Kwoniella shivajii]
MSQQPNRYTQENRNEMPPRDIPKPPESIEYICGDCGAKTAMKNGELIRCRECGHRVMYKPRTTRIVSTEAHLIPVLKYFALNSYIP